MEGKRHSAADVRLRQIVDLRQASAAADPSARAQLWRVARELRLELGDSVPKLPAASALGISVKALDHWVSRGAVPTFRRPGTNRSSVETDAVLDLLEEVADLRRTGVASAVIATAVGRVEDKGRMRRKLRPNESAAELRRTYETTTAADRLRIAAELSAVQVRLAAGGLRS